MRQIILLICCCAVFVWIAVPCAQAQEVFTVLSVNRNLTVQGDAGIYYQLTPKKGLKIKVTGPATLKLNIRANTLKAEPPKGSLAVRVSESGGQISTFTVPREKNTRRNFTETAKYFPSKPQEEVLNVPDGEHTYLFEVTDSGKGGGAIAISSSAAGAEEEGALPLIPLVPVTPGGAEQPPPPPPAAEQPREAAPAWAREKEQPAKPTGAEAPAGQEEPAQAPEEEEAPAAGPSRSIVATTSFWGLVSIGVGTVGIGVGAVFWSGAQSTSKDYNAIVKKLNDGEYTQTEGEKKLAEAKDMEGKARSKALMTSVMFGAGAGLVALGGLLVALDGAAVFRGGDSASAYEFELGGHPLYCDVAPGPGGGTLLLSTPF